jgi:hypothetical protein
MPSIMVYLSNQEYEFLQGIATTEKISVAKAARFVISKKMEEKIECH